MNIIYLDSLFLVNFVCDYILLLCTARVGGAVIRRPIILIASFLGGIYACLCTLPQFLWLENPLLKLCCSVMLCLISFYREEHLLQCSIIFLCISAMIGGLTAAASLSHNGTRYIPLHSKTILLAFSIVYFSLSLFFRNSPQLLRREYHIVTVSLLGKTVSFRAMYDSGNELYDPITNRPVLICHPDVLRPLFSESITWDNDPYKQFSYMSNMECFKSRIRLIPCHTVTGSGMLLGFHADAVTINGKAEPHIVVFSTVNFKPESPYQAIY